MYKKGKKKKQILDQYWIGEYILYFNVSKNKLPAAMYIMAIIV